VVEDRPKDAFEFFALEAVLKTTVSEFERKFKVLLPEIEKNIRALNTHSTLHAKEQVRGG
jgi:hypothetical protein